MVWASNIPTSPKFGLSMLAMNLNSHNLFNLLCTKQMGKAKHKIGNVISTIDCLAWCDGFSKTAWVNRRYCLRLILRSYLHESKHDAGCLYAPFNNLMMGLKKMLLHFLPDMRKVKKLPRAAFLGEKFPQRCVIHDCFLFMTKGHI